ncbi:DNA polymerase III subunit theta [Erwinia billingiae]|uniref:DNA polymerase III subunit theta n=1 Tax=Erwinia billingiae TaxID=182337 RepID=UPI0015672FC8
MPHNLAARGREECDRINVGLATSGIAYKERLNQPVIPQEVEMQQPEELRICYRERVQYYRNIASYFPRKAILFTRKNEKLTGRVNAIFTSDVKITSTTAIFTF